MNNRELDQMLKEWGARNRPDAETLARLEAGMHETISRAEAVAPAETVRRIPAWPRWVAVAAGLAVLLAGGMVWQERQGPETACVPPGNGAAELARISAEQMAARRAILDELDALFDGQLCWVRLDAKQMHLEMKRNPAPATADERTRLVVRTVIVEREAGRTEWKPVWSSDVLTRTEEYVQIKADVESAGELELWVHPLPDGRFVLDSEIKWPAAQLVRPYDTQVFTAGQPQPVLVQTTSAGREYRIYQAVEPLENGRG